MIDFTLGFLRQLAHGSCGSDGSRWILDLPFVWYGGHGSNHLYRFNQQVGDAMDLQREIRCDQLTAWVDELLTTVVASGASLTLVHRLGTRWWLRRRAYWFMESLVNGSFDYVVTPGTRESQRIFVGTVNGGRPGRLQGEVAPDPASWPEVPLWMLQREAAHWSGLSRQSAGEVMKAISIPRGGRGRDRGT